MTTPRNPTPLLHHLRRALDPRGPGAAETDGQLLAAFVAHRDPSAFQALLRRHGPMVLGVCRRVLRDCHAADDAFQATFLILVRKAQEITKYESVGSWLHGVALRTALRARERQNRQRERETPMDETSVGVSAEAPGRAELRAVLDEELRALPAKYRAPLVLYYLEENPTAAVAELLRCPLGTVVSRLTRGRDLLRRRLQRRGLAAAPAALAALLALRELTAAVPAELFRATAGAALRIGADESAVAAEVASLVEGVIKDMVHSKLRVATGLLLAVALVACGAGLVLSGPPDAKPAAEAPAAPKEVPLPADLALVPTDGTGFVSVRVKEFTQSPLAQDVYKQMRKNPLFAAGLKALKNFQVGPYELEAAGLSPADLDRITLYLGPVNGGNPDYFAVVTTLKPYKRDSVLKLLGDTRKEEKVKGKTYYVQKLDAEDVPALALYCPDERTLLVGAAAAVTRFLEREPNEKQRGALHGGLRLAAKNQFLLAINPAEFRGALGLLPLPKEATKVLQPITDAEAVSLAVTLDKGIESHLFLTYGDAAAARAAAKNLTATLDLARAALPVLSASLKKAEDPETVQHRLKLIGQLQAGLKEAPVRQEGKRVHFPLALKVDAAALVGAASELITTPEE